MPPIRARIDRAPVGSRSNYGGEIYYADMLGPDGALHQYSMSRCRSYVRMSDGVEVVYLRCATKQGRCPAKGTLLAGVVTARNQHNHGVRDGERVTREAKNRQREQMEDHPTKRISEAKRELKEELPEQVAAGLNDYTLEKMLRRARRIAPYDRFNRPAWHECEVPNFLSTTRRGTPFLFADTFATEPENPRILIFSSAEMQHHLRSTADLVIGFDASYKMAPAGVYEVFSWHMRIGNDVSRYRYIHLGSAFLPKKDTRTIRRAFQAMFPEPNNLSIRLFVGDWEQAQWKVVDEMFPEVGIQKCHYHHTHNVQKLAKANGLSPFYKIPDTKLLLSAFEKLGFLPLDEVEEAFEELNDKMPH